MAIEDRIRLPNLSLIHRRPRLLKMLEEFLETGQRLITIYAPGGYGKSILLADFAQTTDLPVCWCSLEPADRDPTSFLTLLAHSITDRFHEIEPNSLFKLVERGDSQNSISKIASLLSEVGDHIIIIDDYHKAVSAGMTLALNKLLDQLPAASTMIVAARGEMTLDTGQIIDLLIAERAAGLSEEELKFTSEEIKLVMRKRFGRRLDLDEAAEIFQATDGNIAQILLTGHMRHVDGLMGRLRQRLGNDRDIIYGYLAEEVFGKQSLELQNFMLQTSILPDMTPTLCNELLEIDHAQNCIEALIGKDLFITQIGTGFRYHDLFAEFLRAKLAEDRPLFQRASKKAAQLLASYQRFEESVYLYLSIEAWDEAATLLEAQGKFFYNTGRALTVNQWLTQIPDHELERRPRLLLLHGQILLDHLSQANVAIDFFKQAEDQFLAHDDRVGVAEAQIFQVGALEKMGQATDSLELATHVLEQLDKMKIDQSLMADALRNRGLAYWIGGKFGESVEDLRQALKIYEMLDDKYRVGSCHHNIGTCLEKLGNISSAAYHFKKAIRIWEALGDASGLTATLNSLGVSLYTIGQYDEALKYFSDSFNIALQIDSTRWASIIQAGIGDVYLALGDYNQAVEAFNYSMEFAREANVQALELYDLVKIGECAYQQRDLDQSLRLANQAKEMAAETGLNFEYGLACTLQAKIYVQQTQYAASFDLFAQAITQFSQSDILEEVKTRLWWSYSLLRDLRMSAAFEQLQTVINLAMGMGELIRGLSSTVTEIQPLLYHFLNRPEISEESRDNIQLLLKQAPNQTGEELETNLQVFLFGTPMLVVGDRRRQFHQRGRIRKMPEFLAYILLEGGNSGCRWSEVSAELWPDLPSNRASNIFHQTLKSLREMMFQEPDMVIVQDDYYHVNSQYLEWCDALAFETLFERISKSSSGDSLPLQLELINLYQGQFLSGFELSEWGMTYRTHFEVRFLQVIELTSEQLLRMNRAEEALTIINKGLMADYFRESLHQLMIKAYAQLNLYDHLTNHYMELSQLLAQEFESPPDPTTTQLYEQLMIER